MEFVPKMVMGRESDNQVGLSALKKLEETGVVKRCQKRPKWHYNGVIFMILGNIT